MIGQGGVITRPISE
uniref:Uncharacterized protein n=1 Tax=Anguilla anguilla TaxID=7936 RepID=A0A0E9T624_ANGAN